MMMQKIVRDYKIIFLNFFTSCPARYERSPKNFKNRSNFLGKASKYVFFNVSYLVAKYLSAYLKKNTCIVVANLQNLGCST